MLSSYDLENTSGNRSGPVGQVCVCTFGSGALERVGLPFGTGAQEHADLPFHTGTLEWLISPLELVL